MIITPIQDCVDLEIESRHTLLTESEQREMLRWFMENKIALMNDIAGGVLAECRAREDEYVNYCDNRVESR